MNAIKCSECVYALPTKRKYGTTYHCDKEITHMDITYYVEKENKDKKNILCPLLKRGNNEVFNYAT